MDEDVKEPDLLKTNFLTKMLGMIICKDGRKVLHLDEFIWESKKITDSNQMLLHYLTFQLEEGDLIIDSAQEADKDFDPDEVYLQDGLSLLEQTVIDSDMKFWWVISKKTTILEVDSPEKMRLIRG